ncbi:Tic22 family protein [Thermosynechococcaceae cyanobacterium BACA0444]|uniref:Tic22 family protein n=1 Tax=Pseudocalidococcus azoricus BACA0444 TaxID=2918990 RepID=A0AAE4FR23_9CYAN|nr:Tic22 family protein [Pseudocalidococcus azoricus]MDS3859682.1 Tic22 family protein [Pseudocalidococcus azoricus BACA0444]
MNRLARFGVLASLISGMWIAPAMTRQMVVQALPQEQVLQQLSNVPIFMITNAKGEPLTYSVPSPADKTKQVQVFTFFISKQDAEATITSLKQQQPQIGNSAKVTPASLSGALKAALDAQKNPTLGVDIVPSRVQLEKAIAMLKQSGDIQEKEGKLVTKDGQPFRTGTPLFYVADIKSGNPIAIEAKVQENGQAKTMRFVPFYFDNTQLQTELDTARKTNPDLAKNTNIRVVMLDMLVATLLSSNDPAVGQIQLVQTPDAIQAAVQLQRSSNPAPSPATPASTTPATPPKK